MAFLSLWGQGSTTTHQDSMLTAEPLRVRFGPCWVVILYDTATMDMEITDDLFSGLLGSMGQLYKTFPSLYG